MGRLTPLLLVLLLTACATPPPSPSVSDTESRAVSAWNRGDWGEAARLYTALAAESTGAEADTFRLRAAEAHHSAGDLQAAAAALRQLTPATLAPPQQMRYRLLQAELALGGNRPQRALQALRRPPAAELDDALYARFHRLRARAYQQLDNPLESARELVRREPYLADRATERQANHEAIWQALSSLTPASLQALQFDPPPDTLSGWMELTYIGKQFRRPAEELAALIADWRRAYPNHPAGERFAAQLLERSRNMITRPARIALLLPLSGRFAQAGAAVRDGVLAAYYGRAEAARPTLRVFDVGDNPNDVLLSYEQALDDGAELVIGPLRKEGVSALARRREFPVPTIVLNTAELDGKLANFYQFSLDPEAEARQAALQAWTEGLVRTAVLVPAGEWGTRVADAFSQRWRGLGGEVSVSATYPSEKNDFSPVLKEMLHLDTSVARWRQVARTIGRSPEFEPRRRQDLDSIFLAAFPRQARLIRPQLKFHRAGDLPIVATSHVFSGTVDPGADVDMEGIVFGDTAWTLGLETPSESVRASARHHLDQYGGQLQRLLAMGVDAYNIVPMLKVLENFPYERFTGETGTLSIDAGNRIERRLHWARFSGGRPVPLSPADQLLPGS